MRFVSLVPFTTEIIAALGYTENLVGVSHVCDYPKEVEELPRVTESRKRSSSVEGKLAQSLSPFSVDLTTIKELGPDIIFTRALNNRYGIDLDQLKEFVREEIGENVKLLSYDPRTFNNILECFESVARAIKVPEVGSKLANRSRAQVMDWVDNFYPRTRGKKVTFLCGTDPLILAGLWVPDLIHLTSAVSQFRVPGEMNKKVQWDEIVEFRPDVLIVAPGGLSLNGAMKRLEFFESLPYWEDLPAVKRGEVVFVGGKNYFNRPGPRIVQSMGILVSAIAGLESGYITERDCFQRLRWAEMHRHVYS